MENKDLPAYPLRGADGVLFCNAGIDQDYISTHKPMIGLSKRELIAATIGYEDNNYTPDYATAISGIPSPNDLRDYVAWFKYWNAIEAFIRVSKADALLAELSKPQP